jgi:hypothetical protein
MNAQDDERRVRPIQIEDDASFAPVRSESDPDVDHGPRPERRPLLPLAIAATAIVIVVASVAAFGALQFEDPPPLGPDEFASTGEEIDGSTTTATTIPPRLEDLLGGRTDRLTIIAERDDMLWALSWDPSFREPKATSLDLEETPASRFVDASFDRGGRAVAVMTCGLRPCDLYLGSVRDVTAEPDLAGVTNYIWHASEVARIAWVAPTGDSYEVRTATLNGRTGTVEAESVAFSLVHPVVPVQWDRFGFVVNQLAEDASTIAYAPDGEELWRLPGASATGTEDVVAVLHEEAATWTIVDRRSGLPVDATDDLRDGAVFVVTSEGSDLIGMLADRGDGSATLEVTGGDLRAKRVVTVPDDLEPVGFTEDGSLFLLIGDRQVAFVDWNRGGTRTASLPPGYRIIGLHLG